MDLTLDTYASLLIDMMEANIKAAAKDMRVPNYVRPVIYRGDTQWDLTKGGVGVHSLDHAWELIALGYQW